jgi:hypothetical protein
MKTRKFKVTLTYDVDLEDTDQGYTLLHLMDAVYQIQAGDLKGVTNIFGLKLAFEGDETDGRFELLEEDDNAT